MHCKVQIHVLHYEAAYVRSRRNLKSLYADIYLCESSFMKPWASIITNLLSLWLREYCERGGSQKEVHALRENRTRVSSSADHKQVVAVTQTEQFMERSVSALVSQRRSVGGVRPKDCERNKQRKWKLYPRSLCLLVFLVLDTESRWSYLLWCSYFLHIWSGRSSLKQQMTIYSF